MHITLLSAGNGWHVRDLTRAAMELGHTTRLHSFSKLNDSIGPTGEDGLQGDVWLVRTMPPGSLEQVVFRMDVLHRLEASGIPVINRPRALETCIDKYLAGIRLAGAGVPMPETFVTENSDSALDAFDRLGGDVVVKPLFGSEGRGLIRLTDRELAWRTFRTLERLDAVIYVQRFIAHDGCDLRAFVINEQVIAAVRRVVDQGWRTNLTQGARPEVTELSESERRLAVSAAAAVGASICGVDLLPAADGTIFVLEVNAVPGWRRLAAATGIDVARRIIEFLHDRFTR